MTLFHPSFRYQRLFICFIFTIHVMVLISTNILSFFLMKTVLFSSSHSKSTVVHIFNDFDPFLPSFPPPFSLLPPLPLTTLLTPLPPSSFPITAICPPYFTSCFPYSHLSCFLFTSFFKPFQTVRGILIGHGIRKRDS